MALTKVPSLLLSVSLICVCLVFPSVTLGERHYDIEDLPTVILVPGLGGSQQEGKFVHPPKECKQFRDEKYKHWFTLYADDDMASEKGFPCMAKSMSLVFDNKTGKSHNIPGVETRVKGWGTVDGLYNIDREGYLPYFSPIIHSLIRIGYNTSLNLFGAPYDFRYAPNQLQDFFVNLKVLIEEKVAKKNSPVFLVAHSMGAPLLALFLNDQTEEWRKLNVLSLVTLSGAWGGAVSSIDTLIHGLNGLSQLVPQLRTDQSVMYMMPDLDLWDARDTIVKVGDNVYSMEDIDYLLKKMHLPDNADMYRWQAKYHRKSSLAPHVPLHCLYGNQVPTLERLTYDDWKNFPKKPYSKSKGNGDGTVNHRSLDMCRRFRELQSEPVHVKACNGINHSSMLDEDVVKEYINREIIKIATKRYNDRKKQEEVELDDYVIDGEAEILEWREQIYQADMDYYLNRHPIIEQLKKKSSTETAKAPIISLRELVGPPQ